MSDTRHVSEKLAEQGIRLRNYSAGSSQYVQCPKCSHKRKKKGATPLSVTIDQDNGAVWKCHHCEWSGNVPSDPAPGSDYRERRYEQPKREVKKPREAPAKPARPKALIEFFAARGINEETVVDLGIYAKKEWFPQTQTELPAIVFPYRWQGQLVNNKYRGAGKHFKQDKDALRTLYNADSLNDNDTAIWVEGEMDVAAVIEAGFPAVVSLPDGAPAALKWEGGDTKCETHKAITDDHVKVCPECKAKQVIVEGQEADSDKRFEALWNCQDALRPLKKIILATDGDQPGTVLAEELARRLGKDRCYRLFYPDGCKDLNEVLVKYGPERVRWHIENADPYPMQGLVTVPRGILHDLRTRPSAKMYSTGFSNVDEYLQLAPGRVTTVTGFPGSGKSELIDAITVKLALAYGWKTAVWSPENPLDLHTAKLAEKYMGAPFRSYGLFAPPAMSDDQLALAENWVRSHYTFIRQDVDEPATLDFILDRAALAVMRHGCRVIVIDPYNEIEDETPRGMRETDYVKVIMTRLRKFAQAREVVLFFVAHPQKISRDRDGKIPVPGLNDISGSAHFAAKTDNGITVHRPDPKSFVTEVHITKVRFKAEGMRGHVAKLFWDKATGRYGDHHDDNDE